MASIPKKHTTTTVLFLTAAALAAVLVGASIMAVGGDQMAFASKPFFTAFLFKGDHGKQASSTTTTNTGGNGVGGSRGDHGKQASSTTTGGTTKNDQRALCITVGGNSPITGSCTDTATTTTTFTGGIGVVGAGSGDHGKQAIEQPTKNDQKALCITVGGNSPITGSCLQITASTTSNSGGVRASDKLPIG